MAYTALKKALGMSSDDITAEVKKSNRRGKRRRVPTE